MTSAIPGPGRPQIDSDELLREFAASTAAGFYLRTIDPPEFLYVNDGLRMVLGLRPTDPDPVFADVFGQIHPEDLARIAADYARGSAEGPRQYEMRVRRRDGEYRWLRVTSNPVPNNGEAAVRSVGTVEDIHDRKVAERALAQSEERFRQLSEHVDVGFTLFDMYPTPEFSYVNPAYKQILGLPRDAPLPLLTPLLSTLLHPDDRHLAPTTAALLSQGRDVDEELRIVLPDGELRWLRSKRSPVFDDQGQVARVAGTTEDITVRKNSEIALQLSEERFRQLADNVSVGFTLFSVTEPPELVYANDAFFRIIGHDPESARHHLAQLLRESIVPEDAGRMRTAMAQVFGGREVDDEIRIIRPDGKIRWTRTRRSPVFDENGTVIRVAGTTEDITERKAGEAALRSARAEAERANAAKNEFLSRMSHELRTPLNAVLGFAQLLEMDSLTESQADSVGYILRGGRHLLDLINDVLDISGIEADRLELSMEPVLVGALLYDAIRLVRPLAVESGVDISFDSAQPAAQRYVRADLRRIRQVLINLLSNAIKYNQRDGWVDVSCELVDETHIRLIVADGGIGIREEDMPRLFTPFDRLGQQTSVIDGAGIGLALSQRLVAFMGGSLDASSVHGRGSVFSVVMPLTELPTVADADLQNAGGPSVRSGIPSTLLYIEDNHSNVKLMQRILARRPGWTLVHVDSGIDGLQQAEISEPALIMLDLHLPDMNGIDVFHALRERPATAEIPVVVASADASPGQITRMLSAGVNAYVTKPLDVNEVLRLLDAHARVGNSAG